MIMSWHTEARRDLKQQLRLGQLTQEQFDIKIKQLEEEIRIEAYYPEF